MEEEEKGRRILRCGCCWRIGELYYCLWCSCSLRTPKLVVTRGVFAWMGCKMASRYAASVKRSTKDHKETG